jgi:ATP-dependent DNA helicase RecG
MIIHDADTFGLASLHQLRGRIGRDGSEAICLLVVQDKNIEGLERLQVLVKSNDGFYIAEQDLALRGPGEMTGMKQAGLPGFQYLNIVLDQPIIKTVKAYLTGHH